MNIMLREVLLLLLLLQTYITIPTSKLDIIVCDNKQGTCVLIDFAFCGDRNVTKKEAEKILNYKDLTMEIRRMLECDSKSDAGNNRGDWNRFKITQTVPEQRTGESAKIKELPKTAILCTAHILREVLM